MIDKKTRDEIEKEYERVIRKFDTYGINDIEEVSRVVGEWILLKTLAIATLNNEVQSKDDWAKGEANRLLFSELLELFRNWDGADHSYLFNTYNEKINEMVEKLGDC